jgi:hypothetical protein
MPSPFPGMDSYLEGTEWVSVHAELSSEIARQLAPKLRPKYIVRTIRRFVTEMRVPVISIEIRDAARRDLVTAIEVFSTTNKRGEGYHEYLDKRWRILSSSAHLIEIDLLRKGRRVPMQQPLPAAPYFVFVSRAERRPIVDVWPIQLTMTLPTIPVPLLAGDPDSTLDIQLALNTIYDALSYDLSVDYTRPPEIALDDQSMVWAQGVLQSAGLLSRRA